MFKFRPPTFWVPPNPAVYTGPPLKLGLISFCDMENGLPLRSRIVSAVGGDHDTLLGEGPSVPVTPALGQGVCTLEKKGLN